MKKYLSLFLVLLLLTCNVGYAQSSASIDNSNPLVGIDTGNWTLRYYVDEFENPTDEWYITNSEGFSGTYSDSIDTGSPLTAYLLIDGQHISIKLLKNDRRVVKSSYADTIYKIVMLDPIGNKVETLGTMYKGGDRIVIDELYEPTILDALKQDSMISLHITEFGAYSPSSYLIKNMNTFGFAAIITTMLTDKVLDYNVTVPFGFNTFANHQIYYEHFGIVNNATECASGNTVGEIDAYQSAHPYEFYMNYVPILEDGFGQKMSNCELYTKNDYVCLKADIGLMDSLFYKIILCRVPGSHNLLMVVPYGELDVDLDRIIDEINIEYSK